jgi:small-conductance mechanosensitive channel
MIDNSAQIEELKNENENLREELNNLREKLTANMSDDEILVELKNQIDSLQNEVGLKSE